MPDSDGAKATRRGSKTTVRSWREGEAWKGNLLHRRTGHDVAWWNERIAKKNPSDEDELRTWLRAQGVTGDRSTSWSWSASAIPTS